MNSRKQIFKNFLIGFLTFGFLLITLYPIIADNISFDNYFKDYSSLILVFLTYIYVLLTFLILNSNNRLAKEQLRPYVIASFNRIDGFVYFSVKNYGKRPAINTKITISDGFEELQIPSIKGNYRHLLEQKFLAPNQEIKNLVSDLAAVISPRKKDANRCFDFKIEFYDTDTTKYELEYQIDFSNQYAELTIQDETVVSNLKKIREELKEQNSLLKNYFKHK
jgi:hypothetical protein